VHVEPLGNVEDEERFGITDEGEGPGSPEGGSGEPDREKRS